jgi:hypothetical protein
LSPASLALRAKTEAEESAARLLGVPSSCDGIEEAVVAVLGVCVTLRAAAAAASLAANSRCCRWSLS